MHRIGYNLGMAFQIQDDILDYNGEKSRLGKEVGRDLLSGIPTLPLLEALAADGEEGPLHTLVRKKITKSRAKRAIALTHQLGGIERAEKIAQGYAERALNDINRLSNSEAQGLLTRLFERLSKRDY